MELSAEMYTQQYLGEPVAGFVGPSEPRLVHLYSARLATVRARQQLPLSPSERSPVQQERDAIGWTIQHGFKDRDDIVVSELFMEQMYEEASDFLNKVGHHNEFELKLISDGQNSMVHRARLVLSKRIIRAEVKLIYGPGPEWVILRIPILQKGEEV